MSHEHADHSGAYRAVFGTLIVCTLLSWGLDELRNVGIELGRWVLGISVLAVATVKALCVMAIFMHLKFERAWKYVLLAPTVILAIGLPLALLPDVGVHYYDVDVPQTPLAADTPVVSPIEGGGH